jgi:membrane fusion protein (multidrug efflux system)
MSAKVSSRLLKILLVVLLVGIGVGVYFYLHKNEESTDDAQFDGRIVVLAPKVSGYVKALNINDNQHVKAGDVLLEIDPTDYEIRRDRAAAALAAATAAASASVNNLETTNISAPSNLDAATAQVESAQATWQKALIDLNRMKRLSNQARSQEQLDQAVANEKAMHSNLLDAQAKLRSANTAPRAIAAAKANSDQLQAQVSQAEADLAQADKDLADTKVIAPIDGTITNRGVERGDYIQPGQQLGSLVGAEIWVIANFKENQLEHMKAGQDVDVKVDAYPSVTLKGKIDSFQSGTGPRFSAFPPENATGNFVKIIQRVPVKIIFTDSPDKDLTLGPGMSVEPTVYTKD